MSKRPALPQYARWRPSSNDARYIEVRLPTPYGGHVVNRFTVAKYPTIKGAVSAASEYMETVGHALWPDFPNTILPSIKHTKRNRVVDGKKADVGMIVGFDGLKTKHFVIGQRSLKQAVSEAAAFILDSDILSVDSAYGALELMGKQTVLSRIEAYALKYYVSHFLTDEQITPSSLEEWSKKRLGHKVYEEVTSAIKEAWIEAPESEQPFIDSLKKPLNKE